ncbi:MAG: anti-sigma-D factor RsdA [Actinomycetota bacterium]|nr:anti-sigma-D factor RsdA [Actinomycetota bacterium]
MSDDEVRGGYPVGGRRPERNGGLLPEDSKSFAVPALPVDLAAVQADDALLNALCGPNPSPEGSDARLTQVLMAWRREVDTEPMTPLVDTDTALAVVARARRPEPRRGSVLVPFAAAAAVLVIAFSGVGVGVRAAEPGDRLWSLTKVLYTEHARSVEAAVEVREQLKQADTALEEGRPEDAGAALQQVEQELAAVAPDEKGRAELLVKRNELRQSLESRPGTGDGAGATSSRDSGSAPAQEDPPASAESPTASEAPPSEEPPVSSTPGPDSPADPGPGTGGQGSAPAPRYAPPSQTSPPVTPAPPESFPKN